MTPEEKKELHEFLTLRIEKFICATNSSFRKLSLELGKNQSYIQKIMDTDAMPKLTVLNEICEVFDVRLCDFLNPDLNEVEEMARPIALMKNLPADCLSALCVIMKRMQEVEENKEE